MLDFVKGSFKQEEHFFVLSVFLLPGYVWMYGYNIVIQCMG